MDGKYSEVKRENIFDRTVKELVHCIDGKPIKSFGLKYIESNEGELIEWHKVVKEYENNIGKQKEHELKCIYCQLFLNKFKRIK